MPRESKKGIARELSASAAANAFFLSHSLQDATLLCISMKVCWQMWPTPLMFPT